MHMWAYIPQTVFTLKGFWRIVFWVSEMFDASARPPRPLTFVRRLHTW